MNQEVYEALKWIMDLKYVHYETMTRQMKRQYEENYNLVESWIDEVAKEYDDNT